MPSPRLNRSRNRRLRIEQLEYRELLAVTVNTLIDEADGSITDGDVSLRDAIALAPNHETINFDQALDNALLGLINGPLHIAKPLTIDATNLPNGITITAQGNSRVFLIDDDSASNINVRLQGLKITGGSAGEGGAGIHSTEPLTVTDTTVFDNGGHGIYAEFNNLTVESSSISGNQGVGVFSYGAPYINFANTKVGHSLTVMDSTIAENDLEGISTRFTRNVQVASSRVLDNGGTGIRTSSSVSLAVDITPPNHDVLIANTEVLRNAGRGIGSGEGDIEVLSSVVSENQGGGISNGGVTGSAVVTNTLISDNTSEFTGGGISASKLTASGITVRGNTSAFGGGIYLRSAPSPDRFGQRHGRATIIDSAIFNNHATDSGGGLTAGPVFLDLRNSTVSGNTATMKGAGVHLLPASPFSQYPDALPTQFIASSTITNNSAGQSGGGISVTPPVFEFAGPTLINTIVAGNNANPDGSPDIGRTGSFTLTDSIIGVATNPRITNQGDNQLGTAQSPIDAMLEPLMDNGGTTLTHALLEGSPAIDQGKTNEVEGVAYDQRGAPFRRVFGSDVDVGAFERQPIAETGTGDFDQDGDVDGGDFLIWQRNVGTLFGAGIPDGDADQDGDVDGDDLSTWETQYLLTQEVLFTESTTSLGSGLLNHDVDLAHLNDDNFLDAFVTTDGGPNQVWLGNGDGTFTITNQAFGVGNNIYAALGDIDNDGDIDAAIAVANTEVALWLNDGNGLFSSGGTLAANSPLDLALAHLDDDDRLDLFVAQANSPDLVYLNDVNNGWTDTGQQLGNASSKGVEFADLNGDGFLDAFIAHADGGLGAPNSVWFNDGNGVFTDSGQQLGNGTSQHVTLGDIDGDFDIDAVVANEGANRVYLNDGSGVFTATNQALGTAGSSHVQLADFDSDGDLDIYVANWFDQPDRVWINNGLGQFLGTQSLGMDTSSHVAIGDIDNDGDIDAIVAVYSVAQSNRIWLNSSSDGLAAVDAALAAFDEDTIEDQI